MTFKPTRLLLACMVLMFGASQAIAKPDAVGDGKYTEKDKEFYLTADEIFFIRPGLDVEIVDFTIPADMQPEVTFTLTDSGGLGLDVDGVTTPGPVDTLRYMLTAIPQGQEQKVILAGFLYDSGGTLTAMGDGMYRYKFATVLGANYDPDATHTFGIHARRNLTEFDLGYYVDEEVYNFVPSGNSEPMPREIVTTETCNGRCHDPLGMHASHGGPFTDIPICTQCHNNSLPFGQDNEFSFNQLIHSVHEEAHSYPTELNNCQVCHTGGTPTKNFPLVASPNPVPVCDGSGKGQTTLMWDLDGNYDIRVGAPDGKLFAKAKGQGQQATGKWTRDGLSFFVVDPASGDTMQKLFVDNTVYGCSGNAPYSPVGEAALMHTNWLDHPSRAVCGSCHTDVNFDTGENHSEFNFAIDNDDICIACHQPDSGKEFDLSVAGAHQVLKASSQFPGLIFEFVDIVDTDPGDTPTVYFTLMTKNGPISPNGVNRLRMTITGPNEDFSFYAQENVAGSAVKMGDMWAYTFATPIPVDAEGSYTVSIEGRDTVDIDMGGEVSEERDGLENTLMAFAVTDAAATPRRMVVDDALCEACHANLSLHGDNRKNANYCVTCHKPDATDEEEAPAEGPLQSIHMKYMVHKIHAGAELDNGYAVFGHNGSFNDFSDVEFPGDLRNCEKCHVNDSYELPLPEGLLATETPQELFDPMLPVTAACVGCHDSNDTVIHAEAQTTAFGESCNVCHGEGADFAVEKVHAR